MRFWGTSGRPRIVPSSSFLRGAGPALGDGHEGVLPAGQGGEQPEEALGPPLEGPRRDVLLAPQGIRPGLEQVLLEGESHGVYLHAQRPVAYGLQHGVEHIVLRLRVPSRRKLAVVGKPVARQEQHLQLRDGQRQLQPVPRRGVGVRAAGGEPFQELRLGREVRLGRHRREGVRRARVGHAVELHVGGQPEQAGPHLAQHRLQAGAGARAHAVREVEHPGEAPHLHPVVEETHLARGAEPLERRGLEYGFALQPDAPARGLPAEVGAA
ncbi:MAG: hypothetical protein DRN08_07090, partial [Thermoplasmata archaeon]